MSNAQSLLIDLIKLDMNTMTKTEIKAKWTGADWGTKGMGFVVH